jgi:hypothetical protein
MTKRNTTPPNKQKKKNTTTTTTTTPKSKFSPSTKQEFSPKFKTQKWIFFHISQFLSGFAKKKRFIGFL